jgi:hypothetical protein
MSNQISESAVAHELDAVKTLLESVSKGLPGMEVSAGECSYRILSLSRLGLISEEQKNQLLQELLRAHEIGLDQRGLRRAAQSRKSV